MSEKLDTGHSPPRALIEQGLSVFFDYGSVQAVAVVLRYLKNANYDENCIFMFQQLD